jgi:hypothetical protein
MFTLIHFHKKLNMRPFKYTLLFCLFFLLSFTVIKSADILNVTGKTASVINTGIPPTIVGKSKMFCDQNYCYLTISDWTKYHIVKFMRNSTYPLATVVASFSSAQNTIAPVPLTFDVMDYDAEKFYIVTRNSGGYLNRSWIYKENLTRVADTEVTPKIVSMLELSIDSYDFGVVYSNNSLNDNNPREIRELFYTTGYVNSSMMTYYSQPRLLSTVYVPETQEKYLFFSNGTSVYLYIFNNLNLFQTYYTINTHPIVKYSNFVSSNWELTSSIYAYYYNGMVYFAIRQNTPNNNTWYVNAINPTETKNSGSLILLGSGQDLDLSIVDPWVGNDTYFPDNQTTALSFYYDNYPSREKWYVVYERRIASTTYGGLDMMLLTTDNNCLCSDWVNASQCGYDGNGFVTPNVLWQTRSCNPTQCDSGGQFADCTQTAPTITYRNITQCSSCDVNRAYKNPSESASDICLASITIPNGCTNTVVTATLTPDVDFGSFVFGFGDVTGTFNTLVCSYPSQCTNQTMNCSTPNFTLSSTYTGYTIGQVAEGQFQISNAGTCQDTYSNIGWKKYRVMGDICYSCQQPCGATVCMSYGTKEYAVPQDASCISNITCITDQSCYCANGCENGVCKSSNLPTVTGDPFTYIINLTQATFSPMVLSGISLITSLGIAIATYAFGKQEMNLPIITFLAFILFFTMISWLSAWIGIIISISIVLLLSRSLWLKA